MSIMAEPGRGLTVGSLVGVPLGSTPAPIGSPARQIGGSASIPPTEIEGPGWVVEDGNVGRASGGAWRSDGIEALDYNNPFGQVMERVWFDGRVVFAVDLGEVEVDPARVKVAQEYQVVYGVQLDAQGVLIGEPEAVEGQYNIYDSVPGMDRYSPIWQFNYVVVPRDYAPNALRSERDCLTSGYQILRSQVFEN
jgi:hypothetical protein